MSETTPVWECPFEVEKPIMEHRWERLTFLHWSFEPAEVQRLLPPGLEVETFEGVAWVALVPFYMRVALPGTRSVPWLSEFCETNVRTYVRDADGRSGIWFFSLDASRLGVVAVARSSFRLPYMWSAMSLRETGSTVTYDCFRRWPDARGVTSHVEVEPGEPYRTDELSDLEHRLTARWILFSVSGGRHRFAQAEHPPWPLHRARLVGLHDGLVEAAGLPRPEGEPLVHWSPGVDVRIGGLS